MIELQAFHMYGMSQQFKQNKEISSEKHMEGWGLYKMQYFPLLGAKTRAVKPGLH